MSRRKMENLKSMLCDELDKISDKGSISAGDLEAAHKLTDTIKNIYKIGMLEDVDSGYSSAYYDDGRSYARNGEHYVRGHYSYDSNSNGGGGYRDGYSGHNIREHLDQMMRDAPDDRTRDRIRGWMSDIDR